MKVSVIVAVYKDAEALELILHSLSNQTYLNFEVIVAEDGKSEIMKKCIKEAQKKHIFSIIHATQEDKGVRKSVSQNNAIKASSGEYLIFIDGDCILYHNFIENHLALSGTNNIVTGRRVNLGPMYSKNLRDKKITSQWLEKNFLIKYFSIQKDAKSERHSEEGFSIKANGMIHKIMRKLRKKKFPLLGCNMSCYRNAMLELNGFDEGLGNSAMAGDTDLEWRFVGLGYKMLSARYIANIFHLYHARKESEYNRGTCSQMQENQKQNQYICKQGLKSI